MPTRPRSSFEPVVGYGSAQRPSKAVRVCVGWRIMSRFSRALGLGFLGAIAYFTASDDSLAASCDPGKLNASGTCDCPAGYKSQGEPGSATCRPVYVPPKCGGPGQAACPGPPADK